MNSPRITIAILIALAAILLVASFSSGASGDDIMRFVYGGVLATMIGTWALAEMRGNMAESLRNLLIWGAVVLILVLGYENRAAFGL